ncbi:MAG: hydroxysqualene dehydroxylase HpnE [Bryobacteraceae bacterium]|nr:hydroxysqualene dehydroxylase HpnE [Bryobacteraceae bacterium]
MPSVIVAGGGLAGLACAAALGDAGYEVDLFEARPFLGGRATSYEIAGETIDNCQHILLKCCVNLLDFYERLGVRDRIAWHRDFYFMEPGGRFSILRAGALPAPLHFTEAFLRASWLTFGEKLALGRALLAIRFERTSRRDLAQITMLDWLREKNQPPRVIERFWRQVLVSAINEELDRMAACHGFQVFWLGFLAARDSYEMGIPNVPLGELYSSSAWKRLPNVRIHTRAKVESLSPDGAIVNGERRIADAYVDALPPTDVEFSPITGIHLWFDRAVTELPHGTLLDRTIQWFFNKDGGRYLQIVVSASRSLLEMPRQDVIDLAVRELREFLPRVREASILKAHVVKEARATFSATPAMEARRPGARSEYPNVFRAGDFTSNGWPATMEGAVRSGYLAAEAVSGRKFLLPDIA